MTSRLILGFPLGAILVSAWAWFQPEIFQPFKPAIVPLLAIVMLTMGLTLTWDHFRQILRNPAIVFIGVGIQFLIMPAAAFFLGKIFGLSPAELTGMVLVGSSAGGTASNVICYLAKGNVALSVLMTLTSTLLAVVATPALTYLYLHQNVPVPAGDMLLSILKIVLLPVLAGVFLNTWLGGHIKKLHTGLPLLSSAAIIFIIAIIVALNQSTIAGVGLLTLAAVILHNLCGLACGYGLTALLGYDPATRRTIAIEVGMQNSGLSVALAVKYFSTAAALPGALFSLWHNISGALLASYWRRSNDR
ncbi:MAG: bile acid:sodium symporter [Methylothermaceae bacteria B42]|nr:MAG: bile acid:sodium symporter [Methylothermaceae bacteria B42]HHJ38660.1 bile acid:sodium symporter family protein [Methylothermaceae bacterium]